MKYVKELDPNPSAPPIDLESLTPLDAINILEVGLNAWADRDPDRLRRIYRESPPQTSVEVAVWANAFRRAGFDFNVTPRGHTDRFDPDAIIAQFRADNPARTVQFASRVDTHDSL